MNYVWAMHEPAMRDLLQRLGGTPQPLAAAAPPEAQARRGFGGERAFRRVGSAAVIDVCGPMTKYAEWWHDYLGGCASTEIEAAVNHAAADPDVAAIVLRIDSPGGTVAGTGDLADTVFRARARKRVVAYISDLGCSAAYWVAAQAHTIVANPSAVVGSIGTYVAIADWSAAFEEGGIKVHVIKAGEYKGAGVLGTPLTEAQRDDWQRVVDEINALFLAGVARGRGLGAQQVAALADGRVHVGAHALRLRLIDQVAAFEDLPELRAAPAKIQSPKQNIPTGRAAIEAFEQAMRLTTWFRPGGLHNPGRAQDEAAQKHPELYAAYQAAMGEAEAAADDTRRREAAAAYDRIRFQESAMSQPTQSATHRWNQAIAAKVAAGMSHSQATAAVVKAQPALHAEYLREFNAAAGRRVR